MKSRFNEEFLRGKGFEKLPDGSWGRPDPSARDQTSRANPQCPSEEPLEEQSQAKEPDASSYRRCVAIVTIFTCNARDYDGLGAATKAIFDRLIELGHLPIPDDGPDFLEVLFDQRQVHKRSEEKTIIEVYLDPDHEQQSV